MKLDAKTTIRRRRYDDKTMRLALSELLSFLERSPGCGIDENEGVEIDFVIRGSRGYSVKAEERRLVFTASSPVEILYAVYTFAEECLGVCFFEPGHDRLTKKKTVRLADGAEVITERTPVLRNRGFVQEYPFDETNYALGDWMAKNRLNYLLTWMKYYDAIPEAMKEFYQIRGIMIESGHHNFEYWISTPQYYETHPEYFAILNGERIKPQKNSEGFLLGAQLCASNPDVRRQIADSMVAYCDAHPEVSVISLIPNDGFGWCECEACSRFYNKEERGELYCLSEHVYKANRLYHDMVGDIARQVGKMRPGITLTFAAYINYVEPAAGFELTQGIGVHFAPYWRCLNHAIGDQACPINSRYREALRQWHAAKKGGVINVYEYYMGVNLYLSLPMVHHEMVFDEIPTLRANGADGLLTQFHLTHWAVYGLNFYLMAKAMWGDDKQDSVDKAFHGIFGRDARVARDFYSEMRELQASAGFCHIPYPRSLLRRTTIERYRRVHEKAEALLALSPNDRFRQGLQLWATYLLRFKTLYDKYMTGEVVRPDVEELLAWIRQNAQCGVFVLRNCEILFKSWLDRIDSGKPWYHYGLDWEDEYIKRHDTLLNQSW